MTTCLLGLGSNLGDREATLRAAMVEITALPDVQLVRHSSWYPTHPIGGPPEQGQFLNAAAVIETTVEPLPLLDELKHIEIRHGRQPAQRWAARTLDIDILLYGNEVTETEMLTLPHPRMTFRPFVLAPAAEIAPKMLHPTIGWPIERFLLHSQMASDQLAIVSPSAEMRSHIGTLLCGNFNAQIVEQPSFATAEHHWPAAWTTWFAMPRRSAQPPANTPARLPYAAAEFPKLSILLDAGHASPGDRLRWSTLVRQPGRGPTLRFQTTASADVDAEVSAAIEAVWP